MGRVYFNARRESQAVDGAYTVKNSDSGKIFMLSSTGGACEITLPTLGGTVAGDDLAEEGLFYKFIVEEDTPANAITIAAGSALIDMVMKDIGGNASNSTADTAVSNILIGTATKQGDYVNLFHDGTSWYGECLSSTNNSITTS